MPRLVTAVLPGQADVESHDGGSNTSLIEYFCDVLDWEHAITVTVPPAPVTIGAAFTPAGRW